MSDSILQEAERLINGDRAQDYCDVTENFGRIAKLWGAYRGQFFDHHDVAMMMILVKVARQSSGYHRDSVVDIAGYAALDEKVNIALSGGVELGHFVDDGPELIPGDDLYLGTRFPKWVYSGGEWTIHVGHNETADETPKPRQWDSLWVTPYNVRVRDSAGAIWEYHEDKGWGYTYKYGGPIYLDENETFRVYDNCGPFVEILDLV